MSEWTKVEKEKEDSTKVEKEKTEATETGRTEKGWLGGPWFFDWFSGVFRGIWTKVIKEKESWTKITR